MMESELCDGMAEASTKNTYVRFWPKPNSADTKVLRFGYEIVRFSKNKCIAPGRSSHMANFPLRDRPHLRAERLHVITVNGEWSSARLS